MSRLARWIALVSVPFAAAAAGAEIRLDSAVSSTSYDEIYDPFDFDESSNEDATDVEGAWTSTRPRTRSTATTWRPSRRRRSAARRRCSGSLGSAGLGAGSRSRTRARDRPGAAEARRAGRAPEEAAEHVEVRKAHGAVAIELDLVVVAGVTRPLAELLAHPVEVRERGREPRRSSSDPAYESQGWVGRGRGGSASRCRQALRPRARRSAPRAPAAAAAARAPEGSGTSS